MSIEKPEYDNRGVIEKITSGNFNLNSGNIADIGNTVLDTTSKVGQFVPGVDIIPYSTPLGVAFDGLKAYSENEAVREEIAGNFGKDNVRQLIRRNPALKRKLEKDVDWLDLAANAGTTIGGAALGGTVGAVAATAFFFPVLWIAAPVLTIAGGAVGGGIANSMYNAAFVKQEQDPIVINMQLNKIHAEKGYVPPEIVFAALAANLPDDSADKLLKKYTGTKLFTEALSDHNNIPMLTAMMSDPKIEVALRREYRLPHDPQNPHKTVAEQYADMINSGYMKPQNLLNKGEGIYAMAAMARGQDQSVDVPVTPGEKQNYVSKA